MRMIVALAGLSLSLGISLAQEPHPQLVPQNSRPPIEARVYHQAPSHGAQPLPTPHYIEWQVAPGANHRNCPHGRCPAVQREGYNGVNNIGLGADGRAAGQECPVSAHPAEPPSCACRPAADRPANCPCARHSARREQCACTKGEKCCRQQATAYCPQPHATADCRCGASGHCDENCQCAHGRGCACGQQTIALPARDNVPRFQVLMAAPDMTAAVRPAWPVGRACDVITSNEEFHGTLCHADEQWFVLENDEGRHWIRASKVERVTEVGNTAAVAWRASEGCVPGCERGGPLGAECEFGSPAAVAPHYRAPRIEVIAAPTAEAALPPPSNVLRPHATPMVRDAEPRPNEHQPAVVPSIALPGSPQPSTSPAPAVPPTAHSPQSDCRAGACRPLPARDAQSAQSAARGILNCLGLDASLNVDIQPRETAEQVLVELKFVQPSETGDRVVACPMLVAAIDRMAYVECEQLGQVGVCVRNTDAGNMEVAVFQGSESSQPRAKGQLANGDGMQLRWNGGIAGGCLHVTVHRLHPQPVLRASYSR